MQELFKHDSERNIQIFQTAFSLKNRKALQQKMDDAEKDQRDPFAFFNDVEVMQWFVHRETHLRKEQNNGDRTKKEYERELSMFITHLFTYPEEIGLDLGDIIEGSLFKSLSPRHIRRYQEWLYKESPYVVEKNDYAAATLARKTTILKSFFRFLYQNQYIRRPLHEGMKTATVRKDDRPDRDLGPREVKALLDHFRKQEHPLVFSFILTLVTTGLRNDELCQLRVRDVKRDYINDSYYLDVLGKGNKRRQVPLKDKTLQAINMFRYARGFSLFQESHGEEPLFMTNRGNAYTPSYLSQYLTRQITASELPFVKQRKNPIGPHTFRHAFAIISRLEGNDVYVIMRSLGHEKIETTMIYLEKIFEREQHAIHQWKSDILGEYI